MPLKGFQVVDLTSGVAGPLVGMILADFGAEVVMVEAPTSSANRLDPDFVVTNRGKKSVVVDASDPERCAWLETLIAGADVCLVRDESTLSAFGIDPTALRAQAPQLVLVCVPPYAGPVPWKNVDESVGLLAADMAVAWRQASVSGAPVDPVQAHLLYAHGAWAATCAIAALVEREKSGFGQTVTVTGVQATLIVHVAGLSVYSDAPDVDTNVGSGGRHPTYSRVQARDGRWLAIGALGPKYVMKVLETAGLESVLNDPRIDGNPDRIILEENTDWVRQAVLDRIASRDRDDWVELFESEGIPVGALNTPAEWFDHEQCIANEMRVSIDDDTLGRVEMPGQPVRLLGTPAVVDRSAPRRGEHQDLVTPRPPRVAEGLPPLAPGPLFGQQVLDVGTFVATPYAGMLLASLGATVIKVEPLEGDPFRQSAFWINRGMESLSIDLRNPEGRDTFFDLVKSSDAVIDGLRPGAGKKLGIDYDHLTEHNPDIIGISLSAYGEAGPMSQLPGFDMVVQGVTGEMHAQGGDDEPVTNTIAINDVSTAIGLALANVLAMLAKARFGTGQRGWTSIAGMATYLQSTDMVRFQGRQNPPLGATDYLGPDAFNRYYKVVDGWLRIQSPTDVTEDGLAALASALDIDLADAARDPAKALAASLEHRTGDDAVEALESAGFAAIPARKAAAVIRDPQLLVNESFCFNRSIDDRVYTLPGRLATFDRTMRFGPMTPPGLGDSTETVLTGIGYSAEKISKLLKDNVIKSGPPMRRYSLPVAYR
jgi:crotonobetainyl-CoA:carnitine CoA-transferase CaiB-like acyl-CoA transferase